MGKTYVALGVMALFRHFNPSFRLLVIAEPESRFSLIEDSASASPELEGYTNAVTEIFVEQAAKLEYVSIQNLSQNTWHFASHHARVERDASWTVTADSDRAGVGSRTTSPGPVQPRASPAPTSPTGRNTSTTTRSRSTPPRTRRRTSRSVVRCTIERAPSGEG
jgi:hypothetical protein